MSQPQAAGPYLLFTLAVSLLALVMLALGAFVRLDPATAAILAYADNAVCVLFLVDFGVTLYRAERKREYLLRWGWLDLLSSIPTVDTLRWGRVGRVARILRVLRGIRSGKILADVILRRRAEGAFLAVALLSLLLVLIGSIAVLQFETSDDANIRSPEDALWWAVVTMTTVGYGDRFPVSSEGRVVAAILMLGGVGLFGTLSGFVASWFLRPEQATQDNDLEAILAELRGLREAVLSKGTPEDDGGGRPLSPVS